MMAKLCRRVARLSRTLLPDVPTPSGGTMWLKGHRPAEDTRRLPTNLPLQELPDSLLVREAKLGNDAFVSKAPEAVVAKIKDRLAAAEADLARITAALDALPNS